MTRDAPRKRTIRDESGLSLVELLMAMTLLVVVITIGFVVTTTLVRGTDATQRTGNLTGTAQDGMQVLRELFAGAVPAETVSTPVGTQLYNNGCAGGTSSQAFPTNQGPFVSASATDVMLCSVRSGANTAYTYEIYFDGTTCNSAGGGICTLEVYQEPLPTGTTITGAKPTAVTTPTRVESIANVECGPCVGSTGTLPFVFSTTPANSSLMPAITSPPQTTVSTSYLSSIQAVDITLILTSSTNRSVSTATLSGQVMLPNALGGVL